MYWILYVQFDGLPVLSFNLRPSDALTKFFFAYPSKPAAIGQIIEAAKSKVPNSTAEIHLWPQNDVCGLPLTDPIFAGIKESDGFVADITKLNFNVTFEIGFAIGSNKRSFLVANYGLENDLQLSSKIGIFDTLGHDGYENSDDLATLILAMTNMDGLNIDYPPDRASPVYIVEMPVKSELMTRLVSQIKKTRLRYRSFNPQEHIRLSATDAIAQVSASSGVVVPIASDHQRDHLIHNIRAAFVAGLSLGMEKPTLIIQEYGGPLPLDVRDLAHTPKHPDDIIDIVQDFSLRVVEGFQEGASVPAKALSKLANLSVGDPMAENEFQQLGNYYLAIDEYQRALRGEINLVVGRKGMGKTALFSQLRDAKRNNRRNIVVDLKPEGYQLVRLKERILDTLSEGTKSYLISAFWSYLLYLEIGYKILEKDQDRHLRDQELYDLYVSLQDEYYSDKDVSEGDFSERLLRLSDKVIQEFESRGIKNKKGQKLNLDGPEITQLIYRHDLPKLRDKISEYLKHKNSTWIIFDNLDKGWPSQGLTDIDLNILRSLIDSSKKIMREMGKNDLDFNCVVFIRNDVFELLMQSSADFGKEMRASLDWSDVDLMKTMMKMRLLNDKTATVSFEDIWNKICISHHKGEDAFHYLLDRSLMRPRNLIKLFIHCKGYAVNKRHERIESDDIESGLRVYSNDILIEANQELSDISPSAEDLLYKFVGEGPELSNDIIYRCFEKHGLDLDDVQILDFLLYFGFFGVKYVGEEPTYIYNDGYNLKVMKARMEKNKERYCYFLNPAFWPALKISNN